MADESDDEEARRARADRLHAQIERARSGTPPPPPPSVPDDEESPRDRIARRMRELDDEEDAGPLDG